MSPEQAEGGDIDFRSDVFSFGSLLYEMLTRQRAFAGASTVSILAKIIHTQPPIPNAMSSVIDSRLQEIVNRCLRKDRSRRFQSMGDVRVRLQEIIDEPVAPEAEQRRPATPVWKYAASAAVLVALGAAGAAFAFWPRHPAAPPTFSRLTWDGGLTAYPAVSRDGTMLAYASDRGSHGNLVIWIERLGAGDPIPLTSDSADQSAPDISPDGARVAYRSERNGGGVYVSSLGGTPRLVAPECRDPKYSPDNTTIACWIGDVGGAFYPKTARIVLVPATGGPMRPFRPDFDAAAFPLWMPDGRLLFLGRKTVAQHPSIVGRLLSLVRKTDTQDQPIIDWWIAGESQEQGEHATGAATAFVKLGLEPVPGTYRFRPAAWQSGGGAVLFSAHRDDATNVWRLPISSSGTAAAVPEPVTLGAGSDERPTAPAVLAPTDRDFFVFSRIDVDYQLRQVPLKSSNAQPEPLLPAVSQIGSPSASVDGRRVVYSAPQPNGYRVVSVDMATTDERSVTTVESHDFVRVLLSGDGKIVVYSGPDHVDYRMRIDQGPPEAICVSCGWPTHVNLDGSAALFESYSDRERLIIGSKGTRKLLIGSPDPKNRRQYAGRFSPNDRWVAFCAFSPDGNAREIVIVPNAPDRQLRDEEWVSISDGETSDREPAWSADGRRLFFISDRDGFRCIWARDIDPETGRPSGPAVAIAHFHHTRELLRGPMASTGSIGLTATAKALVFTVARSIGDIWWQRAAR
jgi:Tol biopolymer transport system component